jgi:hypothetical protein
MQVNFVYYFTGFFPSLIYHVVFYLLSYLSKLGPPDMVRTPSLRQLSTPVCTVNSANLFIRVLSS